MQGGHQAKSRGQALLGLSNKVCTTVPLRSKPQRSTKRGQLEFSQVAVYQPAGGTSFSMTVIIVGLRSFSAYKVYPWVPYKAYLGC